MIEADKPEFVALLTGLAAVKPGARLTKEAHAIWWASMQDWSIEDFRTGCSHLALSIEFMPSPYHFDQLRKAGRSTAGEAWTQAVNACGNCRELTVAGPIYGRGGTCGDPLIDRVVQVIGGYRAIALCETGKLGFLERRFAEHYEQLQDAEDVRRAVPQILSALPRLRLKGPTLAVNLLGRTGSANGFVAPKKPNGDSSQEFQPLVMSALKGH